MGNTCSKDFEFKTDKGHINNIHTNLQKYDINQQITQINITNNSPDAQEFSDRQAIEEYSSDYIPNSSAFTKSYAKPHFETNENFQSKRPLDKQNMQNEYQNNEISNDRNGKFKHLKNVNLFINSNFNPI